MPGPYVYDRVKDTSTTTGTGTLTLANSAPTGFRTFGSVLSNGDTCFYAIVHQSANEWETGVGTYTSSGTTLARSQILASSNSGSAVNFSSGTKDVFISPLGSQNDWLPRITPPVDGDYTWTNQGGASVAVTKGGIYLSDSAGSSAHNWRIRKKSAPTAPYTIDTAFLANWNLLAANSSQGYFGVGWRQSSDGKLVAAEITPVIHLSTAGMYFSVDKWNSATSNSAVYAQKLTWVMNYGPVVWVRIADDNTNRKTSVSGDGQNWQEVHSVGRTDFLTADEVFFGINCYSVAIGMTLISWRQF